MTDTTISDAVQFPQDEGLPNIADGDESWDSAGLLMALAQAVDAGSYVRSSNELEFTGHDGTNDTVDVNPGLAYLDLTGETITVQSATGGNSPPSYDTTVPTESAILIVVPTKVTGLSLTGSATNDVWLAYATDDTLTGIATGDIYLRHGSGLSAPPHPSVKLGQVNPDDATADALLNRGPRFESVALEDDGPVNLGADDDTSWSFDPSLGASGGAKLRDEVNGQDLLVGRVGGPVEVPNSNLRIASGQSIEDGSGNTRVNIHSNYTVLNNETGQIAASLNSSFGHQLRAYSGIPVQIYDAESATNAVQYDTDATAGVLRTPNAGMRVESDGQPSSGAGIETLWTGTQGFVQAYDQTNAAFKPLKIIASSLQLEGRNGYVDLSSRSQNLRLATGSDIEDGGGTDRIKLPSGATFINTEGGKAAFRASDTLSLIETQIPAGYTWRVRDKEGSFTAYQYTTAASAPGTLELTNADLQFPDGRSMVNKNGSAVFKVNAGVANTLYITSGTPLHVHDSSNSQALAKFTSGSPGTLELTNARIDIGNSNLDGAIFWPDAGGGLKPGIWSSGSDGEIRARDDDGNQVVLT